MNDQIFTPEIQNKINLFDFADNNRLKRKICDLLKNHGKMFIYLSSVLTEDNFFKYEYKNISEAFHDLIKEFEIFSFFPSFMLSKETDEEIYKNVIMFDIAVTFNKDVIRKESDAYLNELHDAQQGIRDNNKNIVVYYLYRLLKEERCYFYPMELLLKKLLHGISFGNTLKDIYSYFLGVSDNTNIDDRIFDALKKDLFLSKKNNYLNYARVSGEESFYYNKKEIGEIINFDLKSHDTAVIFLRQNINLNSKYNSLIEEIIDYFNDFLDKNQHIKNLIHKNLPEDKKYYVSNLNIFNFEEILQTLIDTNNISLYHLSEKYKKEFQIITKYISENQKFFLDNVEFSKPDESFSKDLKEDIVDEFRNHLSKTLIGSENGSQDFNFIFEFSDFMERIYKSIKKDKNIVMRIFNNEIKNRYCFFMYFKINEETEEVEFFNTPVESRVVAIPVDLLKEISLFLINSDFSNITADKNNILLMLNVLNLVYTKPQVININLELLESIKTTGFYNKDDLKYIIELLEHKYKNLKQILKAEDLIYKKQIEIDNLLKHKFLNSLKIFLSFIQKIIMRKRHYKIIKDIINVYDKKLQDKKTKDRIYFKKLKNEDELFRNEDLEKENNKIAGIIDKMEDDEKKLFTNIYNCLKNKGIVEYEYRDQKLKVEIYLTGYYNEDAPQMFIYQTASLQNLIQKNFITIERKNIRLTDKLKRYFNI